MPSLLAIAAPLAMGLLVGVEAQAGLLRKALCCGRDSARRIGTSATDSISRSTRYLWISESEC